MKTYYEFTSSVNQAKYYGTQSAMRKFKKNADFSFEYFEHNEIEKLPSGENVIQISNNLVAIEE